MLCVLLLYEGSLEETFFDSHLWLDSDCEDYFSVNGGKTLLRICIVVLYIENISANEQCKAQIATF